MGQKPAKSLWLLPGCAIAITLLGAGAWGWRAAEARAAVAAALPAQPKLDSFVPDLRVRIEQAERRAQRLWDPVGGLTELARLYHANGFLAQASECERALCLLDGSNPLWPYLWAHTLGGFGDLGKALPLLQQTIELAPDYLTARIRLGDTLLKRNQIAEAAMAYRSVLSRAPGQGYATIGLARTHLADGRPEDARRDLLNLLATQPEFGPGWMLLISIDEQLDDEAAAAAHRLQSRNTERSREMPDPWVDELMFECYDPYRLAVAAAAADPANNQTRARQLLERGVKVAPNDDLCYRLLGNLLSDLGELATARDYLESASIINPKNPDNWSYLVRVLKAMQDMPAANRALDAGLANCPEAPVLHLEQGRRLAAAGQYEAAAAALAYSRKLLPDDSTASMELARVRFRQDRLEEGVAELRKVVSIDPNHPVAVVLLARYAISIGDESEAVQWIERARSQPKLPVGDLTQVLAEFREKFGRMP